MTFYFETYGCQMNIAEAAALKQILLFRGWSEKIPCSQALTDSAYGATVEMPNLVIINTCAVRNTAEQRVMGRLDFYRALKKRFYSENYACSFYVLVTGCMADRLGDKLFAKGADFVLGTQQKQLFDEIFTKIEKPKAKDTKSTEGIGCNESSVFLDKHFSNDTFSSFVPIMHGCNNFCTYCIVPYVRGKEISRNPSDLIAEIDYLSTVGVKEITLLGQNVNSYMFEDDKKRIDFTDLLLMIADSISKQKNPVKWVRFLSSHPKDLSMRTINVMANNDIFCRHLHLCVQHGSNRILAAMNRQYTKEKYLELIAAIKCAIPDISLSTDILVGFPGETEEDFDEVLGLMDTVRFSYSYMYHFNPREGTAAFDMPNQIEEKIKLSRLSKVIELQQKHTLLRLNERLKKTEEVLAENISHNSTDELKCRTMHDESVIVSGGAELIGGFINVKLQSIKGNTIIGNIIERSIV
ncbi:MAG: tRNA (N6-isopentenyl adenosine(37)-C2)-methylthiotransferase MiaB [Termitinemataceae bacterium]|nr:MAG: tRNA (N6-isopentenyl adenosine(37)-C2)-methylthiotransferase MiaB [Termitinemataceae bacterium]